MKLISSSEFRKTYQHLKEPHLVLVHGHVIGMWTPQGVQVVNQYGTMSEPGVRKMMKEIIQKDRPILDALGDE